jgi:hypothetical protein
MDGGYKTRFLIRVPLGNASLTLCGDPSEIHAILAYEQ